MPKSEPLELLDELYRQAQMQFGAAIKGRWFYDGDCAGCGGEVTATKFKGRDNLSINAFIFREHGVLIGYLLCGKCAKYIFRKAEKNPTKQTRLHAEIERNLKQAFIKQLGH